MSTPLHSARKKLKLTLQEVAAPVGVDPGNLSRIERCKQAVTPTLAEKLSRFYKERGEELSELEILYPERYSETERKQSSH